MFKGPKIFHKMVPVLNAEILQFGSSSQRGASFPTNDPIQRDITSDKGVGLTQETDKYPYSLRFVLQQNKYENIVDSNIFSACIPRDLPVPKIDDPRRSQTSVQKIPRHPGYIRSAKIDQIFNYIGFIKRVKNREYRPYLPILYKELKLFLSVLEEIVFAPEIAISEDIYTEQKEGLQNFFSNYQGRQNRKVEWIEKIWKHQKTYLENIDMLLDTLKLSGQVFDFKEDPLHEEIVSFSKDFFHDGTLANPGNTDIGFVANCLSKAARDGESKTIWSGDIGICKILQVLYAESDLITTLPQIYQRSGYAPHNFSQLFP